ncbi:MAG: glutamate--tRNA ligase [Planctomycetota bacterium]|nr:MAG: glutamate--tRNA ligase [Planctomycetota bacterium]
MTTTHEPVRLRFAPSPTGYLHVGGARTALFNWLIARRHGGTFILRIEDTDRTRHVADSVAKILDDLRWLGLDWDEGPEVGGPCGPYFQSQRRAIYDEHIRRLLESGNAYYALETPEELAAMRERARATHGGFRYPRPDPLPTIAEGESARRAGRPVVVRFKMPGEDVTVTDDVLGTVTMPADQHEDFVIQKADGFPTYHLACVVDDERMGVTHVLRGQEHLMNTPKHVALQRALGFRTPRYAHLPVIVNMDGSKMSKRDKEKALARGETPPEIEVHDFRAAGYLPEALVNFIALLGWNPGDDREHFSLAELVEAFSLERIGKTNARFDRKKLLAFNTDWAARLPQERLVLAFRDFLAARRRDAGESRPPLIYRPTGKEPTDEELRTILQACAGFRTFPDVLRKAGFLFVADEDVAYDPKAVKKVLAKNDGAGFAMLRGLLDRLESQADWSAEALEALIESVCEEKGVGMGSVAQPLRVAVSGSTVSPSIGLTLALLGREAVLARIRRCLSLDRNGQPD